MFLLSNSRATSDREWESEASRCAKACFHVLKSSKILKANKVSGFLFHLSIGNEGCLKAGLSVGETEQVQNTFVQVFCNPLPCLCFHELLFSFLVSPLEKRNGRGLKGTLGSLQAVMVV